MPDEPTLFVLAPRQTTTGTTAERTERVVDASGLARRQRNAPSVARSLPEALLKVPGKDATEPVADSWSDLLDLDVRRLQQQRRRCDTNSPHVRREPATNFVAEQR